MYHTFKNISLIAIVIIMATIKMHAGENNGPNFHGKLMLQGNKSSSFDSLTIKFKPPYSVSGMEYKNINIITDKNGNFKFKIPKYSEPCMIIILVRHNDKYLKPAEHFCVESNDNITINIFKGTTQDSATFSGSGAEKYNLTMQLEKIDKEFYSRRSVILQRFTDIPTRFSNFNQLISELNEKKVKLIKNFGISAKMQKIIMYENARLFSNWLLFIYSHYVAKKNTPSMKSLIKQNYEMHKNKFSYPFDPIMNLCPIYLELLAVGQARGMLIESYPDTLKLESFYHRIKNGFQKNVSEILITNFFTSGKGRIREMKFSNSTYDSLLRDAAITMTNSQFKEMLNSKLKTTKGEVIYNATFTDLNGKPVTLASLRGKVVLIDLWGIGCSWCVKLHKIFNTKVYPSLKNNKNFVYLSVNIDNTKERWIDGIKSGLYTSTDYLNVYSDGKELNHPFAKNYEVSTLPFGLLIDKHGKIYSNKIIDTNSSEVILNLINNALKL